MTENNNTPSESFQIQRSDILPSKSTRYMVMDFAGEGTFGKVAKCVDMTTQELVAVKILNNRFRCHWEIEMMKAISVLDPEKSNIVRFIDSFRYHSFSCLTFEMLDRSLWDLLNETKQSLNVSEIRPVMQQLFGALDALKGIGIVHADLKPDNVMLVNHKDQPFRVKLIDFGLTLPVTRLYTGMTIQVPPYRAPELTLGLPPSEAVDMWSVGCVIAFLYFCGDIFEGDCDYHRIRAMVHMLGQPEDLLLSAGRYSSSFFSREEGSSSPGWRLKSPEEYKKATGKEPKVEWGFFQEMGSLEQEVKNFPAKSTALEYEDRMAFLNLLQSILQMDAGKRITPREALAHPFITTTHLAETILYANGALQLMEVTHSHSLNEPDNPLSDTVQRRAEQASDSRAGATDTHSAIHEEADLGALKVCSEGKPSSARLSVKDFQCVADESSASEISISGESDTEGYSGTIADVDTSRNQAVVPATICIFKRHLSFPSSSDEDDIMPASSVTTDDSPPTCSSDKGRNSEPVGDTAISTDEDTEEDTSFDLDQVMKYDILPSESTRYLVMDFLGEGSFGKVAKCINMTTDGFVAVKILKDRDYWSWEMKMLKAIRALDPEKTNIVRFIDSFRYQRYSCLAFEMLDRSLWDLLNESRRPLNLNEIRPVMQQLFVAFDALKSIGIVHADLKPDNIMLVNHKDQRFKVKLIDFGTAFPVRCLYTGMIIQIPPYRAPEVTLGLPLSEAVDMWSVGCAMSFLYLRGDIFEGDCDYHRIKAMLHMLGQPEDLLLSAGAYTSLFFSRKEGSSSPGWRLKTPEEYKQATGNEPDVVWEFFQQYEVNYFPEESSPLEYEDRMAFLSLLKLILQMDPGKRITPKEALAHPFITKPHLPENISYTFAALQPKTVTLSHTLNETVNSLSVTEDHRDDQASHSREPVGDTAIATEEDSGAAIPQNDSCTDTNGDNTEEAAGAPGPADDTNLKRKKKNLFQRTCKLFRGVKMRLVSRISERFPFSPFIMRFTPGAPVSPLTSKIFS